MSLFSCVCLPLYLPEILYSRISSDHNHYLRLDTFATTTTTVRPSITHVPENNYKPLRSSSSDMLLIYFQNKKNHPPTFGRYHFSFSPDKSNVLFFFIMCHVHLLCTHNVIRTQHTRFLPPTPFQHIPLIHSFISTYIRDAFFVCPCPFFHLHLLPCHHHYSSIHSCSKISPCSISRASPSPTLQALNGIYLFQAL